jgi:signal transduction histidine kinase
MKLSIAMLHEGIIEDKEEKQEVLQITLNSINRLIRTTETLLDLAKMELNKYSFQRANFGLNPMIRELVQLFRREVEAKGLALKTTAPDHDVEILADRDQIARVFTNLINNALKFTRQGRIEVIVEEEKDCVRCSVADTGPGIAPDDMPRLFKKFSRPGKRNATPGTGLGLSICREILEAHQGKIWAVSAPGEGARFTFTIPKAAAALPAVEADSESPVQDS